MRTYATDLTEAQWALVDSIMPEAKPGGRPRSIDVRAVVNAIFYLLRTGCQWRLLPREFPPWPTVYYYFRRWEQESVWLTLPALVIPSYAPNPTCAFLRCDLDLMRVGGRIQ